MNKIEKYEEKFDCKQKMRNFGCKLHKRKTQMEEKMYSYRYPHPAVTTDCVIFGYDDNGLKVLLIERGIEPFKGDWALPGGFLRMTETAEECAMRELSEETGFECSRLEQFKTFTQVDRDPRERVVTIAFLALARTTDVRGGDDAKNAQWFSLSEIPSLAFDHRNILDEALVRLRERIHFEPIGFDLLPEVFTMPQLQRLYESILGVEFDRRNFHKKIIKLGIVEPEAERAEGTPSRVPSKYKFNAEAYEAMKTDKMFRLEF